MHKKTSAIQNVHSKISDEKLIIQLNNMKCVHVITDHHESQRVAKKEYFCKVL